MKAKTLGGNTTHEASNSARYVRIAELRSLLSIALKYDPTLTMKLMRTLSHVRNTVHSTDSLHTPSRNVAR